MKITLFIMLLIILIPEIVFAAWWNPFSWFKKTKQIIVPIEQSVTASSSATRISTEPISTPKSIEKTPTKNVASPQATQLTKLKETTTPTSTKALTSLDIINVDIETTDTTARISWETTIVAESKILLDGQSYISNRGVGLKHLVEIYNLESNIYYGGVITAIANNAWNSKNFSFATDQETLKIINYSNACGDKCTLKWKTNYAAKSRVVISKKGSTQPYKSLPSYTENGRDHAIETSLLDEQDYIVKIYATTEKHAAEFSTIISIEKQPEPKPAQPIHSLGAPLVEA